MKKYLVKFYHGIQPADFEVPFDSVEVENDSSDKNDIIGVALKKLGTYPRSYHVKITDMSKQDYTHPMSWIVNKIANEDMMWVLFCQLNEVGTFNLLKFVGYYCSDDLKAKWYKAHQIAIEKMESDRKEKEELDQYERDRRL